MLSLLPLLVGTAAAAQNGPYMWGLGGSVNTIIYPTRYPNQVPTELRNMELWDWDQGRGDIGLYGHGVLYVDGSTRLGSHAGMALGSGWSHLGMDLTFDRMFTGSSGFHTFGGVGAGLGRDRFIDNSGDELEISNFIVRAQAGALVRDKTRCYEVSVFAYYPIPLEHILNPGTQDTEIKMRGARYGAVGVEGSVMFGDFTPPRKKKKKVRKGSRGR